MDMANSHLGKIASAAQSNRQKMQCHYMLMEGLVGQQQVLLSRLVKMLGAARSGGATGVAKGQEELKELQGEEQEVRGMRQKVYKGEHQRVSQKMCQEKSQKMVQGQKMAQRQKASRVKPKARARKRPFSYQI
ncbi:hypothetical protein ID866_10211 [Astraeus odoratus]|nr:hypothetical protein ID866_10211 [Astraeus odoratus]